MLRPKVFAENLAEWQARYDAAAAMAAVLVTPEPEDWIAFDIWAFKRRLSHE